MTFFRKAEKKDDVSVSLSDQLSIVSYLGQRELLIPDLFKLLGDKKYACIYDPFSGCGSVSFAAMKAGFAKNFVINESFPVFEALWKLIKNHRQELISVYSDYVKKYCAEPKDKRLEFYNRLLKEFNEQYQLGMMANAAMLFVFLMNFSEDYIPYFDDKMNLSVRANIFVDTAVEFKTLDRFVERVHSLSGLFHNNQILFSTGDFEASLKTVASGDLVIMDPPYPRQAENVFFKLHKDKTLQNNIRTTMERLSNSKVDFAIFYGSRIVGLDNQFDEDQYQVHHLVRLTKHKDYGLFADHIYISRTIALSPEALPPGMGFYHAFFKPNEEMTRAKYQDMVHTLFTQLQKNESLLQIRLNL